MSGNIPAPRVSIVDRLTGQISREWYYFFNTYVFKRLGETTTDTTVPELEASVASLELDVADVVADVALKEDRFNKVTAVGPLSTDIQYPTAKLLHDRLGYVVPYTGATADVYLGANGITANDAAFGGASHNTAFSSVGHQTMTGDARPWRDELGDALSIRSTGTGVSQNNTESTVEFTSSAVAANDYLFCNVQLNHDKDLSSSIYPHIHFFQASNAVPNFILYYRWQINGGNQTSAWTPLRCNTLAFAWGSGVRNNIAYSAPIAAPTGAALSDLVQFRVARDTANVSTLFTGADPYSGAVGITAFDVHLILNSLGSNDEYTK